MPKIAGEETRTDMIRIRVTPAERAFFDAAAEAQGLSLSEYLRQAAEKEADRIINTEMDGEAQ